MNCLKIGVFAYNFPHKKTQEGLLHLFLQVYRIECVLAADPVQLRFYQSKLRIAPRGVPYTHPRVVAERIGADYHVVAHDSAEAHDLIRSHDLDLGVILGARILKKPTIDAFNVGVLNLHPGLLPENRGLDNIKWAILKMWPQGVTGHLIDEKIDCGSLIDRREVDVFDDDTLLDVFLRVQNTELLVLDRCLEVLNGGTRDFSPLGESNYFKAVPAKEEALLMETFDRYKQSYSTLSL